MSMILFVHALPSEWSTNGLALLKRIFQDVFGDHDWLSVNSKDRLAILWHERKHKNCVVLCGAPDLELAKLVVKYDPPTIFLLGSLHGSALHEAVSRNIEPISALQNTIARSVMIDLLIKKKNMLILNEINEKSKFKIIDYFSTFKVMQQAVYPEKDILLNRVKVSDSEPSENDPDRVLLNSYELAMIAMGPIKIFWSGQYFRTTQSKLKSGEISLKGPARILYYGPYFCIPVGIWRVTYIFNVDQNWSGNWIEVKVGINRQGRQNINFELPISGEHRVVFIFDSTNNVAPIEIITTLCEGAIEGLLYLVGVEFERMSG